MAVYRFEVLSVGAVATPLTTTRVQADAARKAVLTIETVDIRVRWDGVDPTAAVGHLLAIGETFTLDNADAIAGLRLISTGATATATVTLEGP